VALKNEFDDKSYRIVLIRTLIGALIGAVPGTIYIFISGQNLSTHPFGMILMQTGSIVGALVLGLGSLSGTIVAALKNRGSGPKSNRLKEYLHPETFPAIPPTPKVESKDTEQTEIKQPVLTTPQESQHALEEVKTAPVVVKPEQPQFEDFDR
jgi:hypothetical protein